jgi:two-component system copper resistance phosphate regulon response regulator CusR
MKPRVLLLEHEGQKTESVRSRLESEGYRVDTAADVHTVLVLSGLYKHDAILLGDGKPGWDLPDTVQQLRCKGIRAPLLVLSERGDVQDRVKGLDAGADDYLFKPFSTSELLARLRAVLRRMRAHSTTVLRVADLELDRTAHRVSRQGEQIQLTRLEFALLELLMNASPRPVSKSTIIEQAWRGRLSPETNVVHVYLRNLRRKIDRQGFSPLLHTVRGVGFCCRRLY